MDKKPTVSIIIPIYNGQDFIDLTITSVIEQTYVDWELIIIDDGSTDDSSKIINNFVNIDKRIRKIRLNESSGGPAYPRNVGIKEACGNYLAFLDADDIWDENKLELQMGYIERYGIDFLHCDTEYIDIRGKKSGVIKKSKIYSILKKFFGDSFAILAINPITLSSCIVKNTKNISFRTESTFHAIEDWFLWIDLSLGGRRLHKLNKTLVYYRVHDSSISIANGLQQYFKGFSLYSLLLVEKKINLINFIILIGIHIFRIIKYKIVGRNHKS